MYTKCAQSKSKTVDSIGHIHYFSMIASAQKSLAKKEGKDTPAKPFRLKSYE